MKNIHKIIILTGFIVFVVGLIITISVCSDFFSMSLIVYFAIIIAIVGVCFAFAQNKTLVNFGTAFSALSGVNGYLILDSVFNFMKYYSSSYKFEVVIVVAVGLMIMLIGAGVKFILQIVEYFESKKIKDNN